MVFRRKITETLRQWKERDKAECALLIDGARRVGKSFIVEPSRHRCSASP